MSSNTIPVIPERKNRKIPIDPIEYNKKIYAFRRKIELFFAKLKENKQLVVRYEKSETAFFAFIAFATIRQYFC